MKKRLIIKIDEPACNGCGLCLPKCPEGALQIIDGKARLVGDLFCDGLGACLKQCPRGAITIEERAAPPYDEEKVMAVIAKQGGNAISAHLKHLAEHDQGAYLRQAKEFLQARNIAVPENGRGPECKSERGSSGCPGLGTRDFSQEAQSRGPAGTPPGSQLRNWPVQITLMPPSAPYLNNADLLIAADCVPFAYADFHGDLLSGKVVLVGCPKLDDRDFYLEKLAQIFRNNEIKSATCVRMEVPCCSGLVTIVKAALAASGRRIPFQEVIISIRGVKLE